MPEHRSIAMILLLDLSTSHAEPQPIVCGIDSSAMEVGGRCRPLSEFLTLSGRERPWRPHLLCDVSTTRSNYSSPLLWNGFPAVTGMKVRFRRDLNTSSAEAAKSQCGIYARFSNCSRPIWRSCEGTGSLETRNDYRL